MIKKILIANRSEIACRVIKACKELGIKTVAVYSEVDKNSKSVLMADEAVEIGPAPPLQSYLNHEKIISAALKTGCDAIHPGYGFLSEKHEFNRKVRESGLIFIGPNSEPMKLLGSKVESRKIMMEAGVPVIPGMKGSSMDLRDFEESAEKIGFPVLIKASDGGGGKGMRIVERKEDLASAFESAKRESKTAFGSEVVYLEKYIENPRHIEFQIAADNYGNVVYLFERECSIQRRHQKIIEETPSTALDPELRKKMGECAVKVAKAANYNNLGTVEFLLDKDKNFYFLEVNARIQVEHPITELTTGIDLVKLQILIASGEKLPYKQEDLRQNGHSIECRIYAEDAENNFLPSSGKILYLKEPVGGGIRFDSGIIQETDVSVFYDPVLAKLITWGANREEARQRMILALKDTIILGVKTSIPFLINTLSHPEFIKGNTYTNFIDKHQPSPKIENTNYFHTALIGTAFFAQHRKRKIITETASVNEIPTVWTTFGKWELAQNK